MSVSSVTWTSEEEKKLLEMYNASLSFPQMVRLLKRRTVDIENKLLEMNLDPHRHPIDTSLTCPGCGAAFEQIRLLDIGITTHKTYYKCVKCSHVFNS